MRKENELEKAARKHRKKQKYPMSIFPDYKKGAEEFNKNSTPINQDALSSADASSGMAEDIRRNKKKTCAVNICDKISHFIIPMQFEPFYYFLIFGRNQSDSLSHQ